MNEMIVHKVSGPWSFRLHWIMLQFDWVFGKFHTRIVANCNGKRNRGTEKQRNIRTIAIVSNEGQLLSSLVHGTDGSCMHAKSFYYAKISIFRNLTRQFRTNPIKMLLIGWNRIICEIGAFSSFNITLTLSLSLFSYVEHETFVEPIHM